MIVITVVYASERSFARSSTTSRTVACRRFQRRSMTAVSSGPRKVFAPRLVTVRSSHLSPQIAAPFEQAGMPFADELPAVREREVQADDELPVARRVDGTGGPVAPLDEAGEGNRRELALGVRLIQTGPEGSARRGVLSDRERVEELQPACVREGAQVRRGAVIGVVVRALEQRGVAVGQIPLPVDPPGTRLR